MKRNIWLDGMMGVIVGDALGCPVQFMSREEIAGRVAGPVKGMESGGVYHMPEGTWTDDSSMALAALDSIRELGEVDLEDIMTRFVDWYEDGEYTPFGEAFDIGNTCSLAIEKFEKEHNPMTCGGTSERSNGNGSLMRIMPACLYAYDRKLPVMEAVKTVHEVGGLTHNHLRAKIACGLYYFCVKEILDGEGSLKERLQNGLDSGFTFYEKDIANRVELAYYGRLRDMKELASVPEDGIKSTGYVVDSLEAAIWSLVRTDSFKDCLLTAVNLGDDSDTIGTIAGGLAALYYGYESIPNEWLEAIQRKDWLEDLINSSELTIDDFRSDLCSLIDENVIKDNVYVQILNSMWRLYDLNEKLDKPVSASEVCEEIHMQNMDFYCGGYYIGAVRKAYRYLLKQGRDYTALMSKYDLL